MKNDIFDFKRFGAFAVRSWKLYAKRYLIHAAIFAGAMLFIMVAVCIFNMSGGVSVGDLREMTPWFVFLGVVFFLTFPVTVMKPFKDRHLLVMENTVPASTTEKWLFVLLNTTVGAAVIAVIALTATVLVGMAITGGGATVIHDIAITGEGNVIREGTDGSLLIGNAFTLYFKQFKENYGPAIKWLLFAFLILGAAMMYAGTKERRNQTVSFILVAVTAFAASFMLMIFPMWLSDKLDMAMDYAPLFTFMEGRLSSTFSMVQYSGDGLGIYNNDVADRIVTWVCLGTAMVFWICAWFNFRERSIK